jgi:hypothetical protein
MRSLIFGVVGALVLAGGALAQTAPTRPPTAPASPSLPKGYASEPAAKAACGSQPVVWLNLKSHVYHMAGSKDYGKTKQGEYMCESDAAQAGRAAKNEKRTH